VPNERTEPSYAASHARTRFPEYVRLTATGSVRAGKIRQLAKRLAFTALSILARGPSPAPQLQRPPNCLGDRRDRGEDFRPTNVGDESFCTATIRSKVNEAIKLEVVLKIKPHGRMRNPIRKQTGQYI